MACQYLIQLVLLLMLLCLREVEEFLGDFRGPQFADPFDTHTHTPTKRLGNLMLMKAVSAGDLESEVKI